jgi:leucyl-tRNA synthetase
MNEKYIPAEVEAAAQAHWAQPLWNGHSAYRVTEHARDAHGQPKPKFYACSMLPYPSGKLHMGHVRNYTINDMMARYMRMKGCNVLMPMGWDAFGLPAENAAMANQVAPEKWTRANIADMKSQMQPLGLGFDWSREVATCDPSYYRWNQWFFLKMLEAGIAERRTQVVNWDPVDQTVLANEQVENGRGWRSGALVEKREIPGYYLKITQYADELLSAVTDPQDPNYLSGWPERVRLMQEHWIGKSEGVRFAFTHDIRDASGTLIDNGRMYVFTTRADTIMGVTFCAVAPEHPLAAHAAAGNPALAAFIEACKKGGTTEAEMALKEKEGLPTGLAVTHPLTGAAVPVWVGNYVLMSYGDGAVMGVPAHDERDFAFANKYGLPIKQVIAVEGETFSPATWAEWYGDKQRGVCVDSGALDGLSPKAAVDRVAAALAAQDLGEKKTTWRLRDWGISRQRYWGTPIPIIHCDDCGAVPVPEADLPVLLPEDLIPDGSGNPLNKCEAFLNVGCPTCGKPARRETDTMDTFVDSAWYYMRYCDPTRGDAMVGDGTRYWMAMDQYIGGIEHAVLHLLYARFWTKAMRDLKLVDFSEPFTRLFTQGMLLNDSYFREDAAGKKRWFYPGEVDVQFDNKGAPVSATAKADGQPVTLGGIEKMSKSKNNVVEPRDIIGRFGADTARLFVMFAGPPEQSAAWSDAGAEGAFRYLRRLWNHAHRHVGLLAHAADVTTGCSDAGKDLRRQMHLNLKQVSADYERLQYNTVVSGAMKMLNAIEDAALTDSAADAAVHREALGLLLRIVYPVAPHMAHGLWQALDGARSWGDLLDAPWPAVDEAALVQDAIELMLQINGKLRGAVRVPATADRAAIEAAARACLGDPELAKFTEGREVKKVIVVPGRLVNLVA